MRVSVCIGINGEKQPQKTAMSEDLAFCRSVGE